MCFEPVASILLPDASAAKVPEESYNARAIYVGICAPLAAVTDINFDATAQAARRA